MSFLMNGIEHISFFIVLINSTPISTRLISSYTSLSLTLNTSSQACKSVFIQSFLVSRECVMKNILTAQFRQAANMFGHQLEELLKRAS
jgi:hypothetical protein